MFRGLRKDCDPAAIDAVQTSLRSWEFKQKGKKKKKSMETQESDFSKIWGGCEQICSPIALVILWSRQNKTHEPAACMSVVRDSPVELFFSLKCWLQCCTGVPSKGIQVQQCSSAWAEIQEVQRQSILVHKGRTYSKLRVTLLALTSHFSKP